MSDTPDKSAVDMMRHAIGHPSRNYYCVECGSLEWSQWAGLVVLGLARAGRKINEDRDQYFHVNAEGRAYLARICGDAAKEKRSKL